jgi:hypothetical protein
MPAAATASPASQPSAPQTPVPLYYFTCLPSTKVQILLPALPVQIPALKVQKAQIPALHTSRPLFPRPQALCMLLLRQYVHFCTSKASKALIFFIFAQVSATAPPSLSGPLRSLCVSQYLCFCTSNASKEYPPLPHNALSASSSGEPAVVALLVQMYLLYLLY